MTNNFFTTISSAVVGFSILGLNAFRRWAYWTTGISISTGDFDQKYQTPMGRNSLPYPSHASEEYCSLGYKIWSVHAYLYFFLESTSVAMRKNYAHW